MTQTPSQPPSVTWDHALDVRVTSTDVTGTTDCIAGICGETEVYFDVSGVRSSISGDDGWVWPRPTPFTTNYCHGWTLPNEDHDCMLTWAVWRPVTAGDALSDEVKFKMRERDTGHDDHFSITDPESDPRFFFNWTRSTIDITNQSGSPLDTWPTSLAIRNTDPVMFGMHRAERNRPFASFVVELHEDDLTRPRAVAR